MQHIQNLSLMLECEFKMMTNSLKRASTEILSQEPVLGDEKSQKRNLDTNAISSSPLAKKSGLSPPIFFAVRGSSSSPKDFGENLLVDFFPAGVRERVCLCLRC